jgi:hypothetical protein
VQFLALDLQFCASSTRTASQVSGGAITLVIIGGIDDGFVGEEGEGCSPQEHKEVVEPDLAVETGAAEQDGCNQRQTSLGGSNFEVSDGFRWTKCSML